MSLVGLIDSTLLQPEAEDPRYVNSPFRNLKPLHAKQKGKRFEMIVADVYKKLGHGVRKAENTDHDRIVDGYKNEIKGATLVKGKQIFSFLQIRPDQDYEKMTFAMFYPDDLVMMEMNKAQIKKCIADGIFKKQHGGNKANSGTFCYYGNKETLTELGAIEIR